MNQVTTNVNLTSNDVPDLSGICTVPSCSLTGLQMNFEFRPDNNYDGSFGFDWMRSKKRGDTIDYEDLLKEGGYTNLKKEYGELTFNWIKDNKKEPCFQCWMTLVPGETANLKLNAFVKDATKNNTHKDIFIGIPEELNGAITLNTSLFQITPDTLNSSLFTDSFKNDQVISIKCTQSFSTNQKIQVFEKKGNPTTKKIEIVELGCLNILANNQYKNINNLLLIKVKSDIGNGTRVGSEISINGKSEVDNINKYLNQFYRKITNTRTLTLDLTLDDEFEDLYCTPKPSGISVPGVVIDSHLLKLVIKIKGENRTKFTDPNRRTVENDGKEVDWKVLNLSTYLDFKFKKEYGDRYLQYEKIYFLEELIYNREKDGFTQGFVPGLEDPGYYGNIHRPIIITKYRYLQTSAHEYLHFKGLKHTFDEPHGGVKDNFVYNQNDTLNIMDYTTPTPPTDGLIYSWKRQWAIK